MERGESSSMWNVATLSGHCFLHQRWKLEGGWCMCGLTNNRILRSLLLHVGLFLLVPSLCPIDICCASTKVLKCSKKHCINPFLICPKGDVIMECYAWAVESAVVVIDTSASSTMWPRKDFLLVLLITATVCWGPMQGSGCWKGSIYLQNLSRRDCFKK